MTGVQTCALPISLILGACGGGGSADPASCVSGVAGLCAALNPDPKPVTVSTLFTTAPSKINLAFGETAIYIISGGTAPYIATSDNTSVVSTTVSGSRLTVNSKAEGPAKVVVVDATGKTITIDVQVFAKGQTGLPSTLFVTAPSIITLPSGGSADYVIGGGVAPYTATSGNTGVVTTTASGTKLTIGSIAAGSTQIAVVDSTGKSVTIDVTVLSKGQTGIPPSIFPQSINAGDCTTNIPFVFTGGTSPFTSLTSDNFGVPVGPALRFGSDNYFTASIKNPSGPFPYKATLTVLDSQSRTATAFITIDFPHVCPVNALLQTEPASSANARITEKLTFQITGGVSSYTVASKNPDIATAVMNSDGKSFNVTANSTGGKLTGTALITVFSGDSQQANIVFTVFPQP